MTRAISPRAADRRCRFPLAAIALAAVVLAGATPPAAGQDDLSLFLDTVDVHLVNVEVVVTDRDGNPVTGLTRDAFTVLEDGEPVEIVNFYAVENRRFDAEAPAPPTADLEPTAAPDTTAITRKLRLVVLLDEANLDARSRNRVLEDLREALAGYLETGDEAMLVALGDRPRVVQKLTSDHRKLDRALAEVMDSVGRGTMHDAEFRMLLTRMQNTSLEAPGSGDGLDNPFFEGTALDAERFAGEIRNLAERRYRRVEATADAIARFAASLAGLPGRKAILYVSDGMPMRAAESLAEAWLGRFEDWAVQNGRSDVLNSITSLVSTEFDAREHVARMVEVAGANRVAFYPLSVGARGGMAPVSAEHSGSAVFEGGRGAITSTVMTTETMTREASLLQLADGTGGLAQTRNADSDKLLARVAQDFSTFYSLGYNPPHGNDRRLHDVEVRVESPDGRPLEVRYSGSYRQKDPLDRLQDLTLSSLHYDVEDNPLGIQVETGAAESAGEDRFRVTVMVRIPFEKILLLPKTSEHAGHLTLFAVVGDDRGRISPFQRVELPIRIPNERILEAMSGAAAYPLELEMRGGEQRLALGVRDQLARVDSTLHVDLDVGAEPAGRPENDGAEPGTTEERPGR